MRGKMVVVLLFTLCGSVMLFGCGSDEEEPEPLKEGTEAVPEVSPELEAKIATLTIQLSDENAEIRRAAALSLASINHPAAVPGLIKALSDEDPEIRAIGADGLGRIGAPAVPALIREVRRLSNKARDDQEPLFEAFRKIGSPAVPALMEIWRNPNEMFDVQTLARDVLIEIGSPAAPALIELLSDNNEEVRTDAAGVLVAIGAPAVPLLIPALSHEKAQVRRLAADILGRIGKPAKAAVPALQKALNDADPAVRQSAALALKEIEKVNLIGSDPPAGGEMAIDGVLTLTFDGPPGAVTVNGQPATVQGETATWKAVGLPPGQQVALRIAWGAGQVSTLTVNVKKIQLVRHEPVGSIPENGTLKLIFDGSPKQVTVNRTPAVVQGNTATWQAVGVRPGQQVTLQIAWEGGDGAIITLLVRPVERVPLVITGGNVRNGDKDIDPQPLNAKGITLTFGGGGGLKLSIDIRPDGGKPMGWIAKWEGNSVTITPPKGKELVNETLYLIEMTGEDAAGNQKVVATIAFVTTQKKVNFIRSIPADGGIIASNGTLTLLFDQPPQKVFVNNRPAQVAGTTATWQARAFELVHAQKTAFRIVWEGGNALIFLTIDGQAPVITGGTVKNGDKDVNPLALNANGITFQFSEPVQKGSIDIKLQGGGSLGWEANWKVDSVTILHARGQGLVNEKAYVIEIKGVKDAAGNEMRDISMLFITKGRL